MRRVLVVNALIVVALTACRAEANLDLDVAPDGSGEVTVEMGVDDELLQLLGTVGMTAEDLLAQLPIDAEVVTRTEGDMTYYTGTQPFSDPESLEALVADVSADEITFEEFDLTVTDEGSSLTAVVVAPDLTAMTAGLVDLEETGEDVVTSRLDVRLPGVVDGANADELLEDGTLRWNLPITGGRIDVRAETVIPPDTTTPSAVAGTADDDGGAPVTAIVIAVVVLAVVVAVVAMAVRAQRRRGARAIEDVALPPPATDIMDRPPDQPS